jgi:hypothetical protein
MIVAWSLTPVGLRVFSFRVHRFLKPVRYDKKVIELLKLKLIPFGFNNASDFNCRR